MTKAIVYQCDGCGFKSEMVSHFTTIRVIETHREDSVDKEMWTLTRHLCHVGVDCYSKIDSVLKDKESAS